MKNLKKIISISLCLIILAIPFLMTSCQGGSGNITTLYVYFLPKTVAMPDALTSCIKIILPILILAFVAVLYEKQRKKALNKNSKLSGVATALAIVIVVSVAMLISCQFKYGAIVIATESMTGELNKGDAVLYESYDGQPIAVDDILVIDKDGSVIVHRVVDISRVDGENRYVTKGDANDDKDYGYITEESILGVNRAKLPYVGYPTLWLRELFKR